MIQKYLCTDKSDWEQLYFRLAKLSHIIIYNALPNHFPFIVIYDDNGSVNHLLFITQDDFNNKE